jgi:hypothetical protein
VLQVSFIEDSRGACTQVQRPLHATGFVPAWTTLHIYFLNGDFQMPKGRWRVAIVPIHVMFRSVAKLQVEFAEDVAQDCKNFGVRQAV